MTILFYPEYRCWEQIKSDELMLRHYVRIDSLDKRDTGSNYHRNTVSLCKTSLCIIESCNFIFYINKSVIPMRISPRFFIYANELLNYSISYKKLSSNMQFTDSLRELNAKLLAEIAELRKENAKISELKKENAEIPELKRKFAEIEAEKVELKARIAELLRQAVEESKRRDVENAELKARIEELEKNKTVTTKLESENAEFRDRITKVEQRQMLNDTSSNNSSPNFNSVADQLSMATHHEKPLVDKKMDTSLPEEPIPEVIAKQSVSAVNISVMDQCDQTTLEDQETNAFLDEVHKKKISDEIRQRNREKKLQAQESLPISPEEKRPHFLDSITQP